MKRILALLLVVSMLLCGCELIPARGANRATEATETTVETTEETTGETVQETTEEPTEEPTEPALLYCNPLNGETLEEPFTNRICATTISNIREALPHVSANEADILMEMFVNGSIVRCLALFSNISDVEAIGSIRSTRLMFNDIVQHYDAILAHGGGSSQCLSDASSRGLDNFNVGAWVPLQAGAGYRDEEYGRLYEHNLFAVGSGVLSYAQSEGMELTRPEGTDYGLVFTQDGTPADGETAEHLSITITYKNYKKETVMEYDGDLGKYVYWQYGKMMQDQITGEPEAFENVIVMLTNITANGIYQVADFVAGGTGYYACGGRIIPIFWTCDDENSPFRFWTEDGMPLKLGVGNTYIAITQPQSVIAWDAAGTAE